MSPNIENLQFRKIKRTGYNGRRLHDILIAQIGKIKHEEISTCSLLYSPNTQTCLVKYNDEFPLFISFHATQINQ